MAGSNVSSSKGRFQNSWAGQFKLSNSTFYFRKPLFKVQHHILSVQFGYNEIMVHGNHVSIQKCIGYGDCINEFGTLVVQRKIVFFTNMFLILFLVQCTSKATDRRMRMDCTSAYNIPFCYNFVLHHLRAKKHKLNYKMKLLKA